MQFLFYVQYFVDVLAMYVFHERCKSYWGLFYTLYPAVCKKNKIVVRFLKNILNIFSNTTVLAINLLKVCTKLQNTMTSSKIAEEFEPIFLYFNDKNF